MAHVLQTRYEMPTLRLRLDELSREWREARSRSPRLAYGVLVAAILAAVTPVAVGGWYLNSLRTGFPDLAAIQKIGEMDQATSVFDEQDRLAPSRSTRNNASRFTRSGFGACRAGADRD
jgi:hypothetical protein